MGSPHLPCTASALPSKCAPVVPVMLCRMLNDAAYVMCTLSALVRVHVHVHNACGACCARHVWHVDYFGWQGVAQKQMMQFKNDLGGLASLKLRSTLSPLRRSLVSGSSSAALASGTSRNVKLVLAGPVSDFNSTVQSKIRSELAASVGCSASKITLNMATGSVVRGYKVDGGPAQFIIATMPTVAAASTLVSNVNDRSLETLSGRTIQVASLQRAHPPPLPISLPPVPAGSVVRVYRQASTGVWSPPLPKATGMSVPPLQQKWDAVVHVDGKKKHLGTFNNRRDAVYAWHQAWASAHPALQHSPVKGASQSSLGHKSVRQSSLAQLQEVAGRSASIDSPSISI